MREVDGVTPLVFSTGGGLIGVGFSLLRFAIMCVLGTRSPFRFTDSSDPDNPLAVAKGGLI